MGSLFRALTGRHDSYAIRAEACRRRDAAERKIVRLEYRLEKLRIEARELGAVCDAVWKKP